MMNRRTFLKSLGILAAAGALPVGAADGLWTPPEATTPAPVFDWGQWHRFELTVTPDGELQLYIDGTNVTRHTELAKRVADVTRKIVNLEALPHKFSWVRYHVKAQDVTEPARRTRVGEWTAVAR